MTKKILILLILTIVMLTFTVEALRTGNCIARETASGYFTYSEATALVSVDHIADGYGKVTDKYFDGTNVIARFVYRVDGKVLYDLRFIVPDGGTVSLDFPSTSGDISEVIK